MVRQNERTAGRKKGFLGRVTDSVMGENERKDAPSATELLKSQHDEVRELFKQYDRAGESAYATRKRLIDEASRQLEIHSELEEKIFYPACRDLEDEDARKMVGESVEEHLIVKRLIKELAGLEGTDQRFESKAAVLKESVEHHADEEESDLFPAAKKEFDDERLARLGAEMDALKQRLTRSRGSAGVRRRQANGHPRAART
jgi:hemerythrin-like domain-containing protein